MCPDPILGLFTQPKSVDKQMGLSTMGSECPAKIYWPLFSHRLEPCNASAYYCLPKGLLPKLMHISHIPRLHYGTMELSPVHTTSWRKMICTRVLACTGHAVEGHTPRSISQWHNIEPSMNLYHSQRRSYHLKLITRTFKVALTVLTVPLSALTASGGQLTQARDGVTADGI